MPIDPRVFHTPIVTDTCSVWNVLSARRLFQAALSAKVHFCITEMVRYECLIKPRKNVTVEQDELIKRYKSAVAGGCFPIQTCDLADLIQISRGAPSALSSGELSCIATAYKIQSLGFMTDEKKARSYGEKVGLRVETTPKLYAWLHFHRHLCDGDHQVVVDEHEHYERRPLTKFFQEAYESATRAAALDSIGPVDDTTR